MQYEIISINDNRLQWSHFILLWESKLSDNGIELSLYQTVWSSKFNHYNNTFEHILANFTDENYIVMVDYVHDFDHCYQHRYYYLLIRLQNNLNS